MLRNVIVRSATTGDLDAIRAIYNEVASERTSTLGLYPKSKDAMRKWWQLGHTAVLVALDGDVLVGWGSLKAFSLQRADNPTADLSVYISRAQRGTGLGKLLVKRLMVIAHSQGFQKVILHAPDENEIGKRLVAMERLR